MKGNDQCPVVTQPDTATILAQFIVTVLSADIDGDCEYQYTDPCSERQFEIRRSKGSDNTHQYHLGEYIPNGRLCSVDSNGRVTNAWDDPRLESLDAVVVPMDSSRPAVVLVSIPNLWYLSVRDMR